MSRGMVGTSMHLVRMPRGSQKARLGHVFFGSRTYTCHRCGKTDLRMIRDYDDTYRLTFGLTPWDPSPEPLDPASEGLRQDITAYIAARRPLAGEVTTRPRLKSPRHRERIL